MRLLKEKDSELRYCLASLYASIFQLAPREVQDFPAATSGYRGRCKNRGSRLLAFPYFPFQVDVNDWVGKVESLGVDA